jgi:hypothetical protein
MCAQALGAHGTMNPQEAWPSMQKALKSAAGTRDDDFNQEALVKMRSSFKSSFKGGVHSLFVRQDSARQNPGSEAQIGLGDGEFHNSTTGQKSLAAGNHQKSLSTHQPLTTSLDASVDKLWKPDIIALFLLNLLINENFVYKSHVYKSKLVLLGGHNLSQKEDMAGSRGRHSFQRVVCLPLPQQWFVTVTLLLPAPSAVNSDYCHHDFAPHHD